MKTIFVTGGTGFIGSAPNRRLIAESYWTVTNVHKITSPGNPRVTGLGRRFPTLPA